MNRDWMPEDSCFDLRQGQEMYLFSTSFRLVMELFKPPIQWVPEGISPGLKLTTRLHLWCSWLRHCSSIPDCVIGIFN